MPIFLHIPRTAGHWIEQALRLNRIPVRIVYTSNRVPTKLAPHKYFEDKQAVRELRFRWTFVRNPISWYESWWKFDAVESNPKDPWGPTRFLPKRRENFNDWIAECIETEPSFVTRMYEWYIGPPGLREMDYIGGYEHLHRHLSTILEAIGINVSPSQLKSIPPENSSAHNAERKAFEWDKDLKNLLARSEISCLNRFYSDEHELQPY